MKRRKLKIALSRSKPYSCNSKPNSIMRNISNKSKPIRKRRSDIYRSFPIVTSKSISLALILKRSPTKISNSANRSKLRTDSLAKSLGLRQSLTIKGSAVNHLWEDAKGKGRTRKGKGDSLRTDLTKLSCFVELFASVSDSSVQFKKDRQIQRKNLILGK